MKIRANAWHLRVFMQAHVHDRGWLDAGKLEPPEKESPEFYALREFEKKRDEMTWEQWEDSATQAQYKQLAEASRLAQDALGERLEAEYTARKSAEIRDRLKNGTMSLCPYFWRTVAAVIVYFGIVRGTRPLRRAFFYALPTLGKAVLVMFALTAFGLFGYAGYSVVREIPTPATIVADIKEGRARKQEVERQKRAVAVRDSIAEAQADSADPSRVTQRKQYEEAVAVQERRSRAEVKAAYWRELKTDAKDFILFVAAIVGSVVLCGITLGVLAYSFSWLVKFLRPVVQALPKISLPETGFPAWLTRQEERIARAWAAWVVVWRDTRDLVAAFARAKVKRVCPYLTIVGDIANER